MTAENQRWPDTYLRQINLATGMVADRLAQAGVAQVVISDFGIEDQDDEIVTGIRQEVFDTFLAEGYELSYSQICNAFHRAAGQLEILSDQRVSRTEI